MGHAYRQALGLNLQVPAETEIVLEGYLTQDLGDEALC